MGGAQPLAATMAGASMLAIECDPTRIDMRLIGLSRTSAPRASTKRCRSSVRRKVRSRLACSATPPSCCLDSARARETAVQASLVTDQTSAHDPATATCPSTGRCRNGRDLRKREPDEVALSARESIANHVQAILQFKALGIPCVDYGNNIRQEAKNAGLKNAFDFPGFVPAYIRPLFCVGKGPFRWAALSGEAEDIARTDAKVRELFPEDRGLQRWLDLAAKKIKFQGLPARICWLGLGQRHVAGLAFNEMVRKGELKAPIVIGRDHLDAGSVASPNRETESMRDGTDAVSDWPLLNLMLNTAARRDLGLVPPRRRRRHGLLAARRDGDRVRRNRGGCEAHRARAVERPGERRDAPRGCRVPRGDRVRTGEAASICR